jgi:hypothetical protein
VSQAELLKRVVSALDEAGIDYMLTGAVASSLQGEPRATHDIDFVVQVTVEQLPKLIRAFPSPQFYLDEAAAREAIETRGVFNLLEVNEGDKVDFWLLTDDPFDRTRFARRYAEQVFGILLYVSRPEDTILQKLKWAVLSGGSEKAFVDALRVYEVQYGLLDLAYIETWGLHLGVAELWGRLQAEAEPI